MCVGVLYDRAHTRRIDDFGGVGQHHAGFFAVLLVLFALANAGTAGDLRLCGASSSSSLASFRAQPLVGPGRRHHPGAGRGPTACTCSSAWCSVMWRTTG